MAAESEVSFSDDLDGSTVRIGVLRTRWNDEYVSNLVDGIKVSVSSISECVLSYRDDYILKILYISMLHQ